MSAIIMEIIDTLIRRKGENDPVLDNIFKEKMMLNGIDPNRLTAETIDDPLIMAKLKMLLKDLRFI